MLTSSIAIQEKADLDLKMVGAGEFLHVLQIMGIYKYHPDRLQTILDESQRWTDNDGVEWIEDMNYVSTTTRTDTKKALEAKNV